MANKNKGSDQTPRGVSTVNSWVENARKREGRPMFAEIFGQR
jgi:hypothetical protein